MLGRVQLGWLRGLGRHESCQHQASSGSFRLSRWSVYLFPKELDEKVATLQFLALGSALNVFCKHYTTNTAKSYVKWLR